MDVAKAQLVKWARQTHDFDVERGSDVIEDVLDEYLKNPQVSGLHTDDKLVIFEKLYKVLNKENEQIFSNWKKSHSLVWSLMKHFSREKIGQEAFTEKTLRACMDFISLYSHDRWDKAVLECMRCLTNMFHHSKIMIELFDSEEFAGIVIVTKVLQRTNDFLIDLADADQIDKEKEAIVCGIQFLCFRLFLQCSNCSLNVLKKLYSSSRIASAICDSLKFHVERMIDDHGSFDAHLKDRGGETHAECVTETLRFAYLFVCNEFGSKPMTALVKQESFGVLVSSQTLLAAAPALQAAAGTAKGDEKNPIQAILNKKSKSAESKLVPAVPIVISLFNCLRHEWERLVKVSRDAKDDDPYFSKRLGKSTTSVLVRTLTGNEVPNYLKFLFTPWSYAIHFLLQFPFPDRDDDSEYAKSFRSAWFYNSAPIDQESETVGASTDPSTTTKKPQQDLKLVDMLGYYVAANIRRMELEKKEPTVEPMDPKHPKNVLPSLLLLLSKILVLAKDARPLLKSRLLPHCMDRERPLAVGEKTYNFILRTLTDDKIDMKVQQLVGEMLWLICDENPHRFVYYVGKTASHATLLSHGFKSLPEPGPDAEDDEGNAIDASVTTHSGGSKLKAYSAFDISQKDAQFNDMLTKIEKSMRVSDRDRAAPSAHSSLRSLSKSATDEK